MGVAQRVPHPLHREVRLPVVVDDDAADAAEQAAAPGRNPVEGQQRRGRDVQPLTPPGDPEPGLVHVLDRRRFHQLADRPDDALHGPGAVSAHPRDARRRQPGPEQILHQCGQAVLGQELVVRQVDHHGSDPTAVLNRAGDAVGKGSPSLRAAMPATAAMRPMLRDHQGPGLGQVENLTGAVAGGHIRRQSRTTPPARLGIMIDAGVGIGRLGAGSRPRGPSARPACDPIFRERLPVRRFFFPAGGLFNPSLDGGLPLFVLFRPSWRSKFAKPEFELGEPRPLGQHHIDQVVFRQKGESIPIHRILRVRLEMNRVFSGSCETAREELDAGEEDPGLGGLDGRLEVLGQPPVSIEPGERALDDPSAGQELEALHARGTVDDLQRPAADPLQCALELGPGIGAVGEDVAQAGKVAGDGGEHRRRAVAVLDLGRRGPRPRPAGRRCRLRM